MSERCVCNSGIIFPKEIAFGKYDQIVLLFPRSIFIQQGCLQWQHYEACRVFVVNMKLIPFGGKVVKLPMYYNKNEVFDKTN